MEYQIVRTNIYPGFFISILADVSVTEDLAAVSQTSTDRSPLSKYWNCRKGIEGFIRNVNSFVDRGWVPVGGLCVTFFEDILAPDEMSQVMILKEQPRYIEYDILCCRVTNPENIKYLNEFQKKINDQIGIGWTALGGIITSPIINNGILLFQVMTKERARLP